MIKFQQHFDMLELLPAITIYREDYSDNDIHWEINIGFLFWRGSLRFYSRRI
jgi:hypothetical protein